MHINTLRWSRTHNLIFLTSSHVYLYPGYFCCLACDPSLPHPSPSAQTGQATQTSLNLLTASVFIKLYLLYKWDCAQTLCVLQHLILDSFVSSHPLLVPDGRPWTRAGCQPPLHAEQGSSARATIGAVVLQKGAWVSINQPLVSHMSVLFLLRSAARSVCRSAADTPQCMLTNVWLCVVMA